MSTDASLAGSTRGLNRLRRAMRSRGFAWALSIALHAVMFLVFFKLGFAKPPQTRRFIIPEARLAGGPAAVAPTAAIPIKLSEIPAGAGLPGGAAPRLDQLSILSVESAEPGGQTVVASAPALLGLSLPGAGVGAGGSASGGGGGGAVGPVSRFFGQAGNAYKVVYVVDVSASLMIYTDHIIREMQDSVRELVASQEFHIILAMPREIREFAPRRLVPANARYKNAAYDFIRVISGVPKPGKADPIEAMKRAFASRPELIYFLTDGDYPDIESEFEAVLKRLNAHGETKITVIGFDPSPAPRALLERIARAHGGHCRFVEPK